MQQLPAHAFNAPHASQAHDPALIVALVLGHINERVLQHHHVLPSPSLSTRAGYVATIAVPFQVRNAKYSFNATIQ